MINILKMHLFRAKKAKITYIAALGMVLLEALMVSVNYLVDHFLGNMYGVEVSSVYATGSSNFFEVFQGSMAGGFLPMMLVLFMMLFLSTERSTGYVKNLVGCYDNKAAAVGAEAILAALYALVLYIVAAVVGAVMIVAFYRTVDYDGMMKAVLYVLATYLEAVGFFMVVNAMADLLKKHVLVMIVGAFYTIYATIVYQLIDLLVLKITKKTFAVEKYTLLGGWASLDSSTSVKYYILSSLIAIAFFAVFFFIDVIAKKRYEMK